MASRRVLSVIASLTLMVGACVAITPTATAVPLLSGTVPVPVVHDLAEGAGFACVRTTAGNVPCWGSDTVQQVSGARSVTDAVQIAAGDDFACALLSNGHVSCWGSDSSGQVTGAAAITGATQIAAGGSTACALLSNGSATCWGTDANGQVTGTRPSSGITTIAVSAVSACALTTDGSVTCWGYATTAFHAQLVSRTFTSITMSASTLCLTTGDGTMECDAVNANGGVTAYPFGYNSPAGGFAYAGTKACVLIPGTQIACGQQSFVTGFANGADPLEVVSNGNILCWIDATLAPSCADVTTSAKTLAAPQGTLAALSGPVAPSAIKIDRGFNRARITVTPGDASTGVTYVMTEVGDRNGYYRTCTTTDTSCVLYGVYGSPTILGVTAVSAAGVSTLVSGPDYNVGAGQPSQPQPPGISGTTKFLSANASRLRPTVVPHVMNNVTLTGPSLTGTTPISGNLDIEVQASDGTPVTDLQNVAPNGRIPQPYTAGAPCDPIQLPADPSTCPNVSETYQFAWDATTKGAPLPIGTYTVFSRAAGTADAFVPVEGNNTFTVESSAPTGAIWQYSTAPNSYTFEGPAQVSIAFFPTQVSGWTVSAAASVDLIDANATVIQHWDFPTPVASVSVYTKLLPIGDYTLKALLTNTFGSTTVSAAVHVKHPHANSVALTSNTGVVYPAAGVGVDFHVTPQNFLGNPITTEPGQLTVSKDGNVVVTFPLSGGAQTVHWDALVNGTEVLGNFSVVAKYTDSVGTVVSNTLGIQARPEIASAQGLTTSRGTVYPYHDGYADSVTINSVIAVDGPFTMQFTSSLTVSRNGILVLSKTGLAAANSVTWNGLNGGKIVPGTYTITLTAQGPEGAASTLTTSVTVSAKRLVLTHLVRKLTPKSILVGCVYAGTASCKSGTAVIGGKKLKTFNYTVGTHKNKDALIAFHQVSLPTAPKYKRWSIGVVGKATGSKFAVVYCNDGATFDTDTCSAGGKFPTNKQGTPSNPLVGPWTTRGMTDHIADFYVIGADKGTLSVATFIVVLDYYALK